MNDVGVTNKRVTAKLPDIAHSGLSKIEPLTMAYTGYTENGISYCTGSRPADNRELMTKLNEVIEKVNLMMEGMNKKKKKKKRRIKC